MEIKIDLPDNTTAEHSLILSFVKTIINIYGNSPQIGHILSIDNGNTIYMYKITGIVQSNHPLFNITYILEEI